MAEKITPHDVDRLREYLAELDKIEAQKKPYLVGHEWDEAWAELRATGEIPEAFKGRIEVDPDGRYFDVVASENIRQHIALEMRYHDDIVNAVMYAIEANLIDSVSGPVPDILRRIIELYPTQEVIDGQTSLFTKPSRQEVSAAVRNAAIERGAIMNTGNRLAAYTADALFRSYTGHAIMRLPDLQGKDTESVFDKTGRLIPFYMGDQQLLSHTDIDGAFLGAITQAVYLSSDNTNDKITIYLPHWCRELNIDPREYSKNRKGGDYTPLSELRLQAVMKRLASFDDLVGQTPNGNYYRVATFDSYDRESETITISAPFLFRLAEYAKQLDDPGHPKLHRLLHGSVANEQNHAAVELANRILVGLSRRGTDPDPSASAERKEPSDGKVTWRAKYSTLIDDCPQLKAELQAIEDRKDETTGKAKKGNAQAYNSKLKNVFEVAFRIIMEKSDAPAKYKDFRLPKAGKKTNRKGERIDAYLVPTKSVLDKGKLVITHRGKNPDFDR